MRIKYWVNEQEGEADNLDALPPSCDKVIIYIDDWVFEIPSGAKFYIGTQGKWRVYPEQKFEIIGYHIVWFRDDKLSWVFLKKNEQPQIIWNLSFKEVK